MKSCKTIKRGMYRFDSLLLVCLLVVVIFGMIGGNTFAASFSADMIKTGDGQTQTGRLFLLDDLYRMDVVDDGQKLTILVNRKSGKTRILIPNEKEYMEIENDSFQSVMNNPFEGYFMMRQRFKARIAGSEAIDGIKCDKVIISSDGQDLVTVWVAKPYAFPIRMVNPATGDRAELKNIKEVRIDKAKFQVPAGYTEKEDLAKKREREEAALPFLTTTATGKAPWARRIGPSGEMRVAVDPEESVRIKFENFTQDESVFTIKGYRAGQPIDLDCQRTTFSLQGKWRRDECLVGVQNQAEEISITVEKGKILAEVFAKESSFSHEDKTKTFFITTGIKDSGNGTRIDPKRQLRLNITSDSQDGTESKIKVTFFKDEDQKDKADETDVVLKNGESKAWDYPPEKAIRYVHIGVAKGGGVQVILEQPAPGKEAAAKKPAVKKAPQPKVTDVFTVTHPSGTKRPLNPGKDLAIIVTGVSADASGVVYLYTDRNQTKKIDTFAFKLEKDQTESLFVPGYKQAGWASVWVHKGSFKVKLDQSPDARAEAAKTKKKPGTAAPSSVKPPAGAAAPADTGITAPAGTGTQTASGDTILNGEVPLMQGTKILKKTVMGPSGRYDLEIPATPEEIINFYKKAMTAKGWQAGIAMTQGPMGVLQLAKGKSQITLRATGSGQKSTVYIGLIAQ